MLFDRARLLELKDAMELGLMPLNRRSQANLAAALTHQAIDYLCEGIQASQNYRRSIAGSP